MSLEYLSPSRRYSARVISVHILCLRMFIRTNNESQTTEITQLLFGSASQHALCDATQATKIDPSNEGVAILPGQKIEWQPGLGMDPYAGWSKNDADHLGFEKNGHHRIILFAYGCVDYYSGDTLQEHHQTGFLYTIGSQKFVEGDDALSSGESQTEFSCARARFGF